MIVWLESLVNDFAPVQGDLGQVGEVSLQGDFEHSTDESCHILGNVRHIRDEREALDGDLSQVTLKEDENLGVCLVETSLINIHELDVLNEVLELFVLVFTGLKLFEFTCLGKMVQELSLVSVSVQVGHKVRHGSTINVVIASNSTHVCGEHSFCLDVVSN